MIETLTPIVPGCDLLFCHGMSCYLRFQQQPWTAGYLAGWPSLIRNFESIPTGLKRRKYVNYALKT